MASIIRINVSRIPQRPSRSIFYTLSRPRSLTIILLFFLILLWMWLLISSAITNQSPLLVVSTLASQASIFLSSFSHSTSLPSYIADGSRGTNISAFLQSGRSLRTKANQDSSPFEGLSSCNLFDGKWVVDDDHNNFYRPGSCPFVDEAFNCFKNGRLDSEFLKLRWKPRLCDIPRFNGTQMLRLLRNKRLVFVGDSLSRNMWESLNCALRESVEDKSRVFEVSGSREFKTLGFYSIKFKDWNCSIDFVKSPFLVKEWRRGSNVETLRLDVIHDTADQYRDADIIVFNSGHWWTHAKTKKGMNYFQVGDHVYGKLGVATAYMKAMQTWAKWVDENINASRTRVFFKGYSASHFQGGQWNSGGKCHANTNPITDNTHLPRNPWMLTAIESVISEMKTPVFYLNITKMTEYRQDGHPSTFLPRTKQGRDDVPQDCSHWCLPGVPDSWNELLYAALLLLHKDRNSAL